MYNVRYTVYYYNIVVSLLFLLSLCHLEWHKPEGCERAYICQTEPCTGYIPILDQVPDIQPGEIY